MIVGFRELDVEPPPPKRIDESAKESEKRDTMESTKHKAMAKLFGGKLKIK